MQFNYCFDTCKQLVNNQQANITYNNLISLYVLTNNIIVFKVVYHTCDLCQHYLKFCFILNNFEKNIAILFLCIEYVYFLILIRL